MEGHTTRMFGAVTGFTAAELRDSMVVEFGCGSGRFLDVVRRHGGIAVGIDLSRAVESARENFIEDEKVLIVQGDVLHPPFKKQVFDAAYSIGLFHHTPAPESGVIKMTEVVKTGGAVACCVYPRKGLYGYPSVSTFRTCYRIIRKTAGDGLANRFGIAYAYAAAFVLDPSLRFLRGLPWGKSLAHAITKYLLPNANLPDPKWRVLDVFDAVTPQHASTHTAEEVRKWLVDAGCANVRQTDWCDTSFAATTRNS